METQQKEIKLIIKIADNNIATIAEMNGIDGNKLEDIIICYFNY